MTRVGLLICCVLAQTYPCALAQEEVAAGSPTSFGEVYRTALIDFKEGHYDKARAETQQAAKLKPDEKKVKFLLGRIAMEQGQFDEAERTIKAVLADDPYASIGYRYLGDVYFRKKDFRKGRDTFAEFVQKRPKDPDGILKIVYCEIGRTDLVAAGEQIQLLDPFHESNPSYYFAKAALARASNQPATATKSLETARTIYGNDSFNQYFKDYLVLFPLNPR